MDERSLIAASSSDLLKTPERCQMDSGQLGDCNLLGVPVFESEPNNNGPGGE